MKPIHNFQGWAASRMVINQRCDADSDNYCEPNQYNPACVAHYKDYVINALGDAYKPRLKGGGRNDGQCNSFT